ncbi:MAG: ferredoxin [Nevskia sp.]|nr:ferredoxin [Nevskia sp.]
MSNLLAICAADEVLEGEIKGAALPDGTRIALFNLHGAYYATNDTCTHESASLSEEGMVDDQNVICGWHLCGFEIATGAAVATPCSEPLQTYPVKLIDGIVHVEY